MKRYLGIFGAILLTTFLFSSCKTLNIHPSIDWSKDFTMKYRKVDSVNSIIAVQYIEGSKAEVRMYTKSHENGKNIWTEVLVCDALVGKNGLGKTQEGDRKTPMGDFGIITAFGIKSNPGTSLPYKDIDEYTWCCSDSIAYNRFIDIRDYPSYCNSGEHTIRVTPHFNYGFFLDYNKECIWGKGSGIFFHCWGAKPYTDGCVAVSEKDMITILQTIDSNTRIVIDYRQREEKRK